MASALASWYTNACSEMGGNHRILRANGQSLLWRSGEQFSFPRTPRRDSGTRTFLLVPCQCRRIHIPSLSRDLACKELTQCYLCHQTYRGYVASIHSCFTKSPFSKVVQFARDTAARPRRLSLAKIAPNWTCSSRSCCSSSALK